MRKPTAKYLIKAEATSRFNEVVEFFRDAGKALSPFEQAFLKRMANDNNLTSVDLGVDTIVNYRTALAKKQSAVSKEAV